MSDHWTVDDMPDLTGKVMVVTGANRGLGYEIVRALARKNATVVMACRNLDKACAAAQTLRDETAGARLDMLPLDLADLASVRTFAAAITSKYPALHALVNNAAAMLPPLTKTRDGFELQFGTNHLGHFALTGLLLDRPLRTPGARIASMSSAAHRLGSGRIDFDNLNGERRYKAFEAYAQSKLANILFILQLNRQLAACGSAVIGVVAHPGWVVTGPRRGIAGIIAQRPARGALPMLRAITDPAAQRNDFFGPGALMELRGTPKRTTPSAAAQSIASAERLWRVSETLTGIHYAWPGD